MQAPHGPIRGCGGKQPAGFQGCPPAGQVARAEPRRQPVGTDSWTAKKGGAGGGAAGGAASGAAGGGGGVGTPDPTPSFLVDRCF